MVGLRSDKYNVVGWATGAYTGFIEEMQPKERWAQQ